ncbi:MAG: DUF1559 domain-containing protein [Gemmataceae bacterium]|nr:DUF1559 domain-containing protein [Gemmataceae bacterium]
MTSRLCRLRHGLTAIQLLVLLGLLLFLGALLLPAVAKVRQAASRTQSTNHLKMLGLSIHNYNDVNRRLPPTAGKVNNQEGSVFFHILPYMEQDNVYRQANGQSWSVATTVIPYYVDPLDQSAPGHRFQNMLATTSYASNWMVFKDGGASIPASFPDGTSNVLIFATRYQVCNGTPNAWAYPTIYTWTPMFAHYTVAKFQVNPPQESCDPTVPQSTSQVMLAGLGDGSVRAVAAGLQPHTWYLVTDPADGQPLNADF